MEKILIFIDNDSKERTSTDMRHVQRKLSFSGLPDEYIDTMKSISDFHNLDEDEAGKIIFDKNNCIVTYSMYTENHFGSIFQLVNFLEIAAIMQTKNLIYIDGSGNLPKDLGEHLKDSKRTLACLNAIESNYIITLKDSEAYRVIVKLNGLYEPPFIFEKIDLPKLLRVKQTQL